MSNEAAFRLREYEETENPSALVVFIEVHSTSNFILVIDNARVA